MKITIVPSAVGEKDSRLQYAISYIIGDEVAMDAGPLGQWLTPALQARIRHVFISHTHMDHVASLPLFLENTFEVGPDCATVYGSQQTLLCLQEDIFNHRLWPDFIALGETESPFLRLVEVKPFEPLFVAGIKVTPLPMNHVVPTLGYVFEDRDSAVAIASDTAPTDEFWKRVRNIPNLRAVVLEASFPDEMSELAGISMHLTPRLFAAELAKLHRPDIPVIAVHIKPKFYDTVVAQVAALRLPQVQIVKPGQSYTF